MHVCVCVCACVRTHDHVAISPQGVLSPCHPLRAPPFRHSHHLKHLGWEGALGADRAGGRRRWHRVARSGPSLSKDAGHVKAWMDGVCYLLPWTLRCLGLKWGVRPLFLGLVLLPIA